MPVTQEWLVNNPFEQKQVGELLVHYDPDLEAFVVGEADADGCDALEEFEDFNDAVVYALAQDLLLPK